jgi:hypothetical protein
MSSLTRKRWPWSIRCRLRVHAMATYEPSIFGVRIGEPKNTTLFPKRRRRCCGAKAGLLAAIIRRNCPETQEGERP